MSASSQLRIGDTDRQEAVDQLSEQFALGRLTAEEFDERSDAAWSARTRGDLAPLFADLPVGAESAPPPPTGRTSGPTGWRGLGRYVAPLVVVLIALTVITHLPFVLLAVGVWLFFGHRRHHQRWGAYHHGYHGYRGGWA